MKSIYENEGIKVKEIQSCPLCGSDGVLLYKDLRDRLFNAPGKWRLRKCLNPGCGLLWLDPMPLEEEIGKFYKSYYTHKISKATGDSNKWRQRLYYLMREGYLAYKYGYRYEFVPLWKKFLGLLIYLRPVRRTNLDFSIMYLPAQADGRLLDVGCGSGWLLKNMRELGWKVEGVDLDPVVVENAKKEGLTVHLGFLDDQQYPSNYFDAITMSHLIEHVYDPLQLLRECYRILKPGGYLVVVTPNADSLGHRIFKNNWRGLEPPRHLHIFTPRSLRHLAEKAGFLRLKISTTIRDADGIFIASRSLQRESRFVSGAPLPRSVRMWARVMQLLEWVLLKVKSDLGEEIVLIAEK